MVGEAEPQGAPRVTLFPGDEAVVEPAVQRGGDDAVANDWTLLAVNDNARAVRRSCRFRILAILASGLEERPDM
jgi:hypothetical protein